MNTTAIWTAAITGLTAIFTATIGAIGAYLTAKKSTEVQVRQIQSESERQKREHMEKERQHRQAYYHQFAVAYNRLDTRLADRDTPGSEHARDAFESLRDLLATIELIGSAEVAEKAIKATNALADAYDAAEAERQQQGGNFNELYNRSVARIARPAMNAAVAAMRKDVDQRDQS